jgi:hypothetical protein
MIPTDPVFIPATEFSKIYEPVSFDAVASSSRGPWTLPVWTDLYLDDMEARLTLFTSINCSFYEAFLVDALVTPAFTKYL